MGISFPFLINSGILDQYFPSLILQYKQNSTCAIRQKERELRKYFLLREKARSRHINIEIDTEVMNLNICFLCCIVLSFEPINTSSYRRFRRQMNAFQNNNPSWNSRSIPSKTPSGSITGTAYYGTF